MKYAGKSPVFLYGIYVCKVCIKNAYLPPKRLYHFILTLLLVTVFYFTNNGIIDLFHFS